MALSFRSRKPKPAASPAVKPVTVARPVEPRPVEPGPKTGPKEIGGPEGPEPTRYGDWERKGICVDF